MKEHDHNSLSGWMIVAETAKKVAAAELTKPKHASLGSKGGISPRVTGTFAVSHRAVPIKTKRAKANSTGLI